MDEARAWAREIADRSPTAITLAKASFNAESEHIRGVGAVALRGHELGFTQGFLVRDPDGHVLQIVEAR